MHLRCEGPGVPGPGEAAPSLTNCGEVRSGAASPGHEDAAGYAATGRRSSASTVSVQAFATSRPFTWKCS